MPRANTEIGLKGYQIKSIQGYRPVIIKAVSEEPCSCPRCGSKQLRNKGCFTRQVRHENRGLRACYLRLQGRKYHCRQCGRYFRQRFRGIMPWKRSTEVYRRFVYRQHADGITRKRLAEREEIGTATVERCFASFVERKVREFEAADCPRILGIDEHFFSRREGFATTLCDLSGHKVYDVVLGRSVKQLRGYFMRLKGRKEVRVVCMDLASNYRALVRLCFPRARIVADRFHVIRLVNHHFLSTWRQLDPERSKNRGLLSLMRRHENKLSADQKQRLITYLKTVPPLQAIYHFKQKLTALLLQKHRTRKQCRKLIPRLIKAIGHLRECGIQSLVTLGETLHAWREEIVTMWRFHQSNGTTEGFHNKMEMISRRSFGFRNFENYRLRVRALCC